MKKQQKLDTKDTKDTKMGTKDTKKGEGVFEFEKLVCLETNQLIFGFFFVSFVLRLRALRATAFF